MSERIRSTSLAVVLLLLMGLGGHNLYRYTWLWFGAFQAVALDCLRRKAEESGAGGQKSEVRGQRSEVRDQRSEVRRQRSEDRGQRSEDSGQ